MASSNDNLTNEKLRERFDNSFTLVNYTIALARSRIRRGENLGDHPAREILREVTQNRDLNLSKIEDIEEEDEEEEFADKT